MNFKKLKTFLVSTAFVSSFLFVTGGYRRSNAIKFEPDAFGCTQSILDKPLVCVIVTDYDFDPDYYTQLIGSYAMNIKNQEKCEFVLLSSEKATFDELYNLLQKHTDETEWMVLLDIDRVYASSSTSYMDLPYTGLLSQKDPGSWPLMHRATKLKNLENYKWIPSCSRTEAVATKEYTPRSYLCLAEPQTADDLTTQSRSYVFQMISGNTYLQKDVGSWITEYPQTIKTTEQLKTIVSREIPNEIDQN